MFVGSADFTAMEELDGDKVILQDKSGRKSQRDIVQFVAFRDFQGKLGIYQAGLELAKNLLKEVPDQLVSYMNLKGLAPGNKVAP
jgi:Copine